MWRAGGRGRGLLLCDPLVLEPSFPSAGTSGSDPRAPSWGDGSLLIPPASSCCRRVGSWCRIRGVLALGGTACPAALSPCPCSSLRQHSPNPLPQILFLPWPPFPPPLLICSIGSVCPIQGFSRDSWLVGVSIHLRGWLSFTRLCTQVRCSGIAGINVSAFPFWEFCVVSVPGS